MDSGHRHRLGKRGEDLACRELQRRGYAILERRYRSRHGEIDIVARCGEAIVFVEVKARAGRGFGGGADAVDGLKQWRVARMAADYLARRRVSEIPCRFDVVTVELDRDPPRIQVYPQAFDAPW